MSEPEEVNDKMEYATFKEKMSNIQNEIVNIDNNDDSFIEKLNELMQGNLDIMYLFNLVYK